MKCTILIRSVFIIGLLALSFACQEKKVSRPAGTIIAPLQNELVPYQIGTFQLDSAAFQTNRYEGTMGGKKVAIGRHQNQFVFVTPDLTSGSYTLETIIDGKPYRLAYSVKAAAKIADPSLVIQKQLSRLDSLTSAFENQLKREGPFHNAGLSAKNLAILKNTMSRLRQTLDAASPQEKAELAAFRSANPWMTEYLQLPVSGGRKAAEEYDYDSFYQNLKPKVDRTVEHLIAVTASGVLISLTGGGPAILAVTTGIVSAIIIRAVIEIGVPMLKTYARQKADLFLKQLDAAAGGERIRSGAVFFSDQAMSLTFESAYENSQSTDAASSFSLVREVTQKFITLNKILTQINAFLPSPIEFDLDLGKQPENIKLQPVSPSLLSISNISGQNVRLKSFSVKDKKLVVAFTLEKGEKESFRFDVTYNNPGVATSTITMAAEITKTEGKLASISVDPPSATISKGQAITLTASAYTAEKKPVTIEESRWIWKIDNTESFAILPSGAKAVITGVKNGVGVVSLTDSKTGLSKTSTIKVEELGQYFLSLSHSGKVIDPLNNKTDEINFTQNISTDNKAKVQEGNVVYGSLSKEGKIDIIASNGDGKVFISSVPNKVGTYKIDPNAAAPIISISHKMYDPYKKSLLIDGISSHQTYPMTTNQSSGTITISSITAEEIVGSIECKLNWMFKEGYQLSGGYDIILNGKFKVSVSK